MVVLLPEAGDRGDQDSDLEDVLEDGEEACEPARELRIEESDSDAEEEPNSLPRKRKRVGKSKWIKSGTSDKPIKSGEPNLSRNLIDELDFSALTIGSKIFSRDIVMMLVHQTNLYANRDKKWRKIWSWWSRNGEISWHSSDIWISYIASCKPLAQEDLCVQIVYNAMSRNRFQENKKIFPPCGQSKSRTMPIRHSFAVLDEQNQATSLFSL